MLVTIDRIQLATPSAEAAAQKWQSLLGAEEIGRDRLSTLGARRICLRAGASDIELLEPDGAGTVESELKRRGRAHVFAAGAASPAPPQGAGRAKARRSTWRSRKAREWRTSSERRGKPTPG